MRLAFVVLVAVAVACGHDARTPKQSAPTPQDAPAADAPVDIARLRAVAKEMCACADRACAERVTQANADLEKDVERRYKGKRLDDIPSEVNGVVEQLELCDERLKIREMAVFRDRMCTCKDEACARAVADDLAHAPANELNNPLAPEPAGIIAAYRACKAKLVHD